MADNLTIRDGAGATKALATKEVSTGLHLTKHLLTDATGTAIAPATQATLAAVLAALLDLAPASDMLPITPNDDTVLSGIRSLYIGQGGTLVVTINGNVRTIENIPDGFLLPAKGMTRVRAATTATKIVALV